jgi:phytoene desaturase
VVGGKLGRYARDGFVFDTGPSLFTLPQVADALFEATGGPADLHREPLDPVVRHRFADGSVLDSSSDPDVFAQRIGAVYGSGAAGDWRRLWRRAARVWNTSYRHVLSSTVDSPLALAKLAWRLPDLAAIAPGRTLRGVGHRYLRDPHLRMLLDRYATYTGADPRRAPAALLAIPYAELHFGGWYLRGGLGTLGDALAARCESLGVRIELGARVTSITTAGGRVDGVVVGGRRVSADIVVANADAQQVYRDLLPSRRAERLGERSLAGFVLLLGVRGTTAGLAHHTVCFPADYDDEFDAVFGARGESGRLADDPTVFVTVADDPLVRPDGHEGWFVLVNAAPHGPVDWRAPGVAGRYADRILDILAARGLDVRDRILFREVRTPADQEAATLTPGGSIYGSATHRLRRPPNRGPVDGLYLVGGSVHPGGGLPLVMLSAELVAREIARG